MQAVAAVEHLYEAKIASQKRSHAAELEQSRSELQRQLSSMSLDLDRAQRDSAAAQSDGGWQGPTVTAAEAERMSAEIAALQDQLQVRFRVCPKL